MVPAPPRSLTLQEKALSRRHLQHRCALGLWFAIALVVIERAHGQESSSQRGWRVATGVTGLEFRNDKRWGIGPMVEIRRMVSHRVSLDLDVAALITNTGPDKFTGIFGNVGPSFVWRNARHDLSLSVGFSAGTEWEETGGRASIIGIFGAGGGVYWLGSVVGLSGRVAYHLWWGDPSPSVNAGVALRW